MGKKFERKMCHVSKFPDVGASYLGDRVLIDIPGLLEDRSYIAFTAQAGKLWDG